MGNQGKKMQNQWYEFQYNRKNGNMQLGKEIPCPNCQKLFGPKSTYNQLNSHLDACLQNPPQSQQQQQQQPPPNNPFHLENPSQYKSLGNDYYWVKIKHEDQYKWERKPIQALNGAAIQNFNIEQASKASFPEKQLWFNQQNDKIRIPWQLGADKIKIDPNDILGSSLNSVFKCNMHKEVKFEFQGDKVQDAGGLLREWLLLMFKEVTSPSLGNLRETSHSRRN